MNYKVGFIGFGGMISGYHYVTISRDDIPFDATAAFDIDPEARANAESKGLRVFDNPEDFFAYGGYDLVVVGTANNYHAEMACRAMEAGFNVMTEKPAARCAEEVERMIAVSKKTGKLFTVHQNRRWDPDFLKIRQAISDGMIGKPWMIESRIHSKNGNGDMYGWRGMKDHGGGMLLDWGVHMLDQLLYMTAEPVKTVSATVRPLWSEEVDDYAKVILTFESGLTAQMEVSTYNPIPLPRWIVYGDRGALMMNEIGDPTVKVRRISADRSDTEKAKAFEDWKVVLRDQSRHRIEGFEELETVRTPGGTWHNLYRNLYGVLSGTEELNVKPEQVLACMKVIDAAFLSSREGITVRL